MPMVLLLADIIVRAWKKLVNERSEMVKSNYIIEGRPVHDVDVQVMHGSTGDRSQEIAGP